MSSLYQVIEGVRSKVDNFFIKNFSSIHVHGPKLDAEKIQQQPLVFACTHRSHIDYILIGINFHKMGFKEMRFAAGDNLTKLPYVGPRFKSLGAFTVERDGGFERGYIRKLCNSVMAMLEKREPVIVFPEGGRSYSGGMLEVKGGILGAAVIQQAKDLTSDVYIIPVAVSYERLPDLPFFSMLLNGKRLKKRNNNFFLRLLGSLFYFGADILAYLPMVLPGPRLRKTFADVHIDYKEPVSIRSIIDITANKIENARDELSAHRVSIQKICNILYNEFLVLYRILPEHVVAYLLKNNADTVEKIATAIPECIRGLRERNCNVLQIEGLDPKVLVEQGVRQLSACSALKVTGSKINIRKKNIIDYYSATIETGDKK